MSKVSVSEAARLAGISRTNFYKNYINKGKISISQNNRGQPEVDTSEILRVFGVLQDGTQKIAESDRGFAQSDSVAVAVLEERIKGLEAIIAVKDELIASQKQQLLLLGADHPKAKRRFWWFNRK